MHLTVLIELRKHGQSTQFSNKQKDMCYSWWRQTDTCTTDFTSQWSMGHGSEMRHHALESTWISQCNDIVCDAVQRSGQNKQETLRVPNKQQAVFIDAMLISFFFLALGQAKPQASYTSNKLFPLSEWIQLLLVNQSKCSYWTFFFSWKKKARLDNTLYLPKKMLLLTDPSLL